MEFNDLHYEKFKISIHNQLNFTKTILLLKKFTTLNEVFKLFQTEKLEIKLLSKHFHQCRINRINQLELVSS